MTRLERYNRNKFVYADFRAGLTRKELAVKYRLTTRRVDMICTNDGALTRTPPPLHKAPRKWRIPFPKRLKILAKDGHTPAVIARIVGLDLDLVEEILRREEA